MKGVYCFNILFVLPKLFLALHWAEAAGVPGPMNDIMEAIDECSVGFQFKNKKCVREVVRKPTGQCEQDYTREGDFCVNEKQIKPAYVCEKNQTLNFNQCEYVERTAPAVSCPNGYTYAKLTGCTRNIEQIGVYICPIGYKAFDKRGICASEKFEKPEFICVQPDSGKPKKLKIPAPQKGCHDVDAYGNATNCDMDTDLEAEELDGDDWNFEKSIMINSDYTGDIMLDENPEATDDEMTDEPSISNKFGSSDNAYTPDHHPPKLYSTINPIKKICTFHKIFEATVSCLKGYTLPHENSEFCAKEEWIKSEEKCPKGYKMEDNVCKTTLKVTPHKRCSDGYEFDGKECVKIIVIPGVIGCEKNFVLTDGKCIKIIEEKPTVHCPPNYESMGKDMCMLRSVQKYHLTCPETTDLINMKCQSTKFTKPINFCPPEYQGQNDQCLKVINVPSVLKCPLGLKLTSPGDKCIKKTYSKALEVCKDGYLLKDGHCYHMCPKPPELSCSDSDATPTPHGTCVKTLKVPPQLECPKGFKLDTKYYTKEVGSGEINEVDIKHHKGECIKVRQKPPTANCPPMFKLKGADCYKKDYKPSESKCDDAYTSDGAGNCVKYEIKNSKKTCPKTHKLLGNFCIQRVGDDIVGKIMETVGVY